MTANKTDWLAIIDENVWELFKNSIVPFDEYPSNRVKFLDKLYDSISSGTYAGGRPRAWMACAKRDLSPRLIPAFDLKELCIYYYCIKKLESKVAINHQTDCFGGWSLGSEIFYSEDMPPDEQQVSHEFEEYHVSASYNPCQWLVYWTQFYGRIDKLSKTGKYASFVCFDIAHFYDSIDLNTLKNQLLNIAGDERDTIDLLFCFLKGWRTNPISVGLPQEERLDCSRILANFYLHDFDEILHNTAQNHQGKYLRYHDDCILMLSKNSNAQSVLLEVVSHLNRINLRINGQKLKCFQDKETFRYYWCFDLIEQLELGWSGGLQKDAILEKVISVVESNTSCRKFSLLKRTLSLEMEEPDSYWRIQMQNHLLSPEFILQADMNVMKKLLAFCDTETLFHVLDGVAERTVLNGFHYQLIRFYQKYRKDYNLDSLMNRARFVSQSISENQH